MANDFDLLIIGAGINGAGIARDAAMRGLKVLLVDKGDVGSGTSSWSTRLIHGGLRYLEHFEFGLVRESLRERETLLRIAPHLVRPLPITIPIYKQGKRGPGTVRAGMIAYDILSLGKSLPRHRMQSPAETLEHAPGLNSNDLLGSALYFDAQIEFAERLVIENVLAAQGHGAEVSTYARVTKLAVEKGAVDGVELLSTNNESRFVRASVIVNAAGPWVDQLLERAPVAGPKLIGGTKGSHIIVSAFAGASTRAIYLEARSDRRPFFIIPWNGNYLIGTTDVRFDEDPDEVRCELWEIDYLLAETNYAFPQAKLTRDRILYTYSGVRPLPVGGGKDEQSITRRHFIREHPRLKNLLSIVGGKLTTYRRLAEECVDLTFRKLGRSSPACDTANVVLPGAIDLGSFAKDYQKHKLLSERVCERLPRIYGSRAVEIIQLCERDRDLSIPFDRAATAAAAEIVFSFEVEFASTLADCLFRRTMIGLNGNLGLGDDAAAAQTGMRFLGWSARRAKREVEMYRDYVKRFMDVLESS